MDECILWDKYKDKNGYGITTYKGKQWRAHRLSYFLNVGNIDPDMFICHKCDNPSCVNPKHLFQGTPLDNVKDMQSKGRDSHYLSENNGRAKLTWESVNLIRKLYSEGKNDIRGLAKQFNVSKSTIGYIVQNKTWLKTTTNKRFK